MKEEIFKDEMTEREDKLRSMNLPDTLRRACVSAKCSICLINHEWKEIMMLTCGHVFHGHCLKKAKKNECPECRRDIDTPKSTGYGGIFARHQDDFDY